jgi:hypothetical protein
MFHFELPIAIVEINEKLKLQTKLNCEITHENLIKKFEKC